MRVTAEVKTATRVRILAVTEQLLRQRGWEQTTTREITAAAGVANGTLFNYFPSKEAIAAALIEKSFARARGEFERRRTGKESLDEDLFALEWAGFKCLRRHRKILRQAVDGVFSPLANPKEPEPGAAIRIRHLAAVRELLAEHGIPEPLPAVALQLYWTLHLGVLTFWAADSSPQQEDSLALLDRAVKLFAASMSGGKGE